MKKLMTRLSLALTFCAAAAGTAAADETHTNSHNAPVVTLVHTGQIDDPMEDVLEHTLLIGGKHRWQ
ncbi:hypothetical protein [Streptomyces cavernicola]|uniref:Uncharacterized protein n=1 Tax=Streptomyces cavernicola TaxID=3043613 RepID=A0ABT6SJL6_9ACTN|nr:hypothetical protein [Streptomyces sp. B-S-A6]MDI3408388.1 hypothetical protein [Streptomyces sp. B-S-A6]